MRRAVFAVLLALTGAAAQNPADLTCECQAGSCPGFKVRFDGQGHAQVAPLRAPGGWSPWRDAEISKRSVSFMTRLGDPYLGCVTIARETGRFQAVVDEVTSLETVGVVTEGVCRPLPPPTLGQGDEKSAQ